MNMNFSPKSGSVRFRGAHVSGADLMSFDNVRIFATKGGSDELMIQR